MSESTASERIDKMLARKKRYYKRELALMKEALEAELKQLEEENKYFEPSGALKAICRDAIAYSESISTLNSVVE
jgi:hypothetical protein